jgi:hypothetical protein
MGSFSTIAGLTPPVLRSQLEYPTVDVPLAYLLIIGKLQFAYGTALWQGLFGLTVDNFADKASEAIGGNYAQAVGRFSDVSNYYAANIDTNKTAQDFQVVKVSAGTGAFLGYEAVDLSNAPYKVKLSVSGTTLKGFRDDMATPKVSVTDTAFSTGKWGARESSEAWGFYGSFASAFLRSASSPSPKALGFYEVPVVGSGTPEDPFRAQLPELIEVPASAELDAYPPMLKRAIQANVGGKVNRLAVSHSALIPTDLTTGKPLYSTCIVRVFEQPDRQPHLYPLKEVLARLETQTAIPIRKLDVTQAIARAKEMDPRLSDFDFYAMPSPSDDEVRKYIEWRRATFGVETRYEDAKHYLESDKGWA